MPIGIRLVRLFITPVILAVVVVAAFALFVRPYYQRWGATDEELAMALPGDEVVPNPVSGYTRAVTINAPADQVWPWIVQSGQGRGGLYSYDWLENLIGCDIHSVDRILPEFQSLKAGDIIRLVPDPYVFLGNTLGNGPRLKVLQVAPGRALVLGGTERDSWALVLNQVGPDTTRLLSRGRAFSDPAWVAFAVGVEPIAAMMELKMLDGIKVRAEGQSVAS